MSSIDQRLAERERDMARSIVSADSPASSVELRQERAAIVRQMRTMVDRASVQHRDLSDTERGQFEECEAEFQRFSRAIDEAETREYRQALESRSIGGGSAASDEADGAGSGYRVPGQRERSAARLTRDQSLAEHVRGQGYTASRNLSFDRMIRGMLIGDWRGADAERRALSEGSSSAGGVLVPTPLAAQVLDMARAQTRVLQAGALTVPMETSTLKIGRQTGDPALAWHTEGQAIGFSDLSFDAIELKAHTLPCLVKASIELLEDVDNLDGIIQRSVAQAIALELDRVALRGSGVDPQPLGLRNASGITVTDLGANGAAPTWDQLAGAVGDVRASNHEPNAAILHPRTETDLTTQKSTGDGQYIAPPVTLAGVQRLSTTQVPVDLTHGTATNASEVYLGQWSQLLIGMRTTFTIRPLTERYIDTGEIAFFAYLRADVAVARPEAFVVLDGVIPAAVA